VGYVNFSGRVTGVLGLSVLLVACASEPEPDPYARQYQCGETLLPVRLDGHFDWLELSLNGEHHILPKVQGASGARYDNGRLSFWTQGEEGELRNGSEVLLSGCHLLPVATPGATAPDSAE